MAPTQSHWLEHTQQHRQSEQRQGTVGEHFSSRQMFVSTGSDWYSAGETIDTKCNSISHLTMSVGEQESLVLP